MRDFIPSVYGLADNVSYNPATQELTVSLPKTHGLVVGDTVRVTADTGTIEERVAAVIGDNTFVLSGVEKITGRAFVYGKRVDDFHSVDYDQLFSMNISATQMLASDNDALKSQVAATKPWQLDSPHWRKSWQARTCRSKSHTTHTPPLGFRVGAFRVADCRLRDQDESFQVVFRIFPIGVLVVGLKNYKAGFSTVCFLQQM